MDLKNVDLLSLQTSHMKRDLTTRALCKAINPQFQQLTEESKHCLIYSRIDDLDHDALDELAWQMHVDYYDPTFSLKVKKDIIKNSLRWHRKKGTPAAVEELLSTIFGSGEVKEWFEYGGKPYMFKVIVNVSAIKDGLDAFYKALNTVKNTRSHLEEFIGKVADINIYLKLKTYTFNVPYKICNRFITEEVPGKLAKAPLTLKTKTYPFDVLYPICNTFVTSSIAMKGERINVVLAGEYRNNDVLFKRVGSVRVGEGDI